MCIEPPPRSLSLRRPGWACPQCQPAACGVHWSPMRRRADGKQSDAAGDAAAAARTSAPAAAVGSPQDLLRGMAVGCGALLVLLGAGWLWRSGALSGLLPGGGASGETAAAAAASGGVRVFTPEQLQVEGSGGSGRLLLAILGEVFDVSAGTDFYAEGKGYNCFVGRDGSRAFVTGEFEGEGLTDSIDGLDPSELDGVLHWRGFYRDSDKYHAVGVLAGRYYDSTGARISGVLDVIEEKVATWKAAEAATKEAFPPCNSKWTQAAGSHVWCTSKSGGTERCVHGAATPA